MAEKARDVYMNAVQQRIFYSGARHVWLLAARRFGKTDGCLGPRIWAVCESMPQGLGAFLGSSRKQLYARTIPGVIAAIERFYGLKEGVHFGWGRPPKNVPKCIIRPKSYDNYMWFANGALVAAASLATIGSVNGMTLNFIIGDECKFLPKKKIDEEVMPALSGIVHPLGDKRFSDDNPYYKSTFFCSDASLTTRGNWLAKGEERLDLRIDEGPMAGMTYGDVQRELEAYAGKLMRWNELLRSAKREGKPVTVVSRATKDRITALAGAIQRREGPFRIISRQWKEIGDTMLKMLITYGLIQPEDAELLAVHRYLVTHEEQMELMAIRGSAKYQRRINDLRCNAFMFVRASSLDNIDILGESYIRQMKLSLPPLTYAISILNLKPKKSGEGFYCNFDEDIHTYLDDSCPAIDASYKIKQGRELAGGRAYPTEYESPDFDYLSSVKDCTLDGDLMDSLPLEIAMDYNSLINWVVVGQLYKRDGRDTLNVINSMFVKNGGMIQDLIRDFDRYYQPHKSKNRNINYYYSNTAKFKLHGIAMDDIKDTVIKELTRYGWQVRPVDEGAAPRHEQKYQTINSAFAGLEYPAIRFNAANNEALIGAITMADVENGYHGFRKSKKGEKLSVDAEDATPEELRTDGTDAFDELYWGVRHFRSSMTFLTLPNG